MKRIRAGLTAVCVAPDELATCLPGATEVEGHPCPVSPLEAISAADEPVVIERSLPEHVGCNKVSAPTLAGATPVVIRPPEDRRDCFSDFAVTLFVDGSVNVVWIDFVLSGP